MRIILIEDVSELQSLAAMEGVMAQIAGTDKMFIVNEQGEWEPVQIYNE